MAGGNGGVQGWDPIRYTREFEKELLTARIKAGKKIGPIIVKESRTALGRARPARRKAINFKVRKNGTMVIIDRGRNARTREYGLTINARAGGWASRPAPPPAKCANLTTCCAMSSGS